MHRAAIYARVSTPGQEEEGTSLETQEQACREYAAARGYEVVAVYRDVYTGTELWDRPQLTRLREAVKAREVDAVIVYALDRLSRRTAHQIILAEECGRAGVELLSATEEIDRSREGELIRYVRGYAAEVEHEKIRERTLRGKRARVQAGLLHNHSVDLYGYRRDKELGVRVVYEPEADVVRRIYRWVVEDQLSLRHVARRLNEQGVPAPSATRFTYGEGARLSHRWGKTQVRRILTEPAYKGQAVGWRYRRGLPGRGVALRDPSEWVALPGTTPAIVQEDVWEAAQRRLQANRGERTRNRVRPSLLRGLIDCAVCGRRMWPDLDHGLRTYRCSSRQVAGRPCGASRVPAEEVEEQVRQAVRMLVHEPERVVQAYLARQGEGPDPQLLEDLERVRGRVARLEWQERALWMRAREEADNDLLWHRIREQIAAVANDLAAARQEAEDLERRLAAQRADLDSLTDFRLLCERVAAELERFGFEEWRRTLEAFGIRVVANGRDWRLRGRHLLLSGSGLEIWT